MSMADIKNRPSRNGFDLSFKKNFTAKAGELLPVMTKVVLPGDSFNINLRSFTRTQPLNTSAFARMREYYDFYFVPFEQMWNKFDSCITQMNANVQHASGPTLDDNTPLSGRMPYFTSEQIADYLNDQATAARKNPFGFNRSTLTCKLLQYLGYGDYNSFDSETNTWSAKPLLYNLELSPFPLLAYQKIYSDFYRYTQWEKTNPSTFNLDYIKGTSDLQMDLTGLPSDDNNFFDIRYCNYQKDMFHGVLPVAQYGSASVVPINGQLNVISNGDSGPIFKTSTPDPGTPGTSYVTVGGNIGVDNRSFGVSGSTLNVGKSADPSGYGFPSNASTRSLLWENPNLIIENNQGFYVPILALRQAEFLQKWKEVSVSGEEDYKSQIEKHWGIKVSDFLSHQARYLGGCATSLDINEVINNNITGDNAADIAGKGTFTGNGSIRFESKGEYGIIMCIYHVLPIVDYVGSGVDHSCTLVDATSFPIPELDQIGMESVPLVRAMNPVKESDTPSADTFLGYAPRYIDWKTSVDRSVGDFADSLRTWCLPVGDKELTSANSLNFPSNPNVEPDSIAAGFFKVNPSIVDPLFAVVADSTVKTDEFLCSSFFDVKVVRNLDVNGLPY
nr:unnamed protein product [uncultured bacterium]